MKQGMREVDAVYGGEMSAHHYFRKFSYADSGMIPWLLVTEIMCQRKPSLVGSSSASACARSPRAARSIARSRTPRPSSHASKPRYTPKRRRSRSTRTASAWNSPTWRFNLRSSNTEPLLRLNVESRGDAALMRAKTAELLELLGGEPG